MTTVIARDRSPSWTVAAVVLCGSLSVGGPAAFAGGLPPAELERHLTWLEAIHELRLARGDAPGTAAALRSLDALRERLGLAGEQDEQRVVPGWRPFEPPRPTRITGESASAIEAVLEWQRERVVNDLAWGGSGVFCECYCDEACDNGQFCDGVEQCNSGSLTCASGPDPSCDDSDECTLDSCNETTDGCEHDPVPSPDEVLGLELDLADPADPVASLVWQSVPDADAYNVYRGEQPDLGDLTCFLSGLSGTSTDDDGALPVGEAFVYLVTATHCGESTLGSGSEGTRVNDLPCP